MSDGEASEITWEFSIQDKKYYGILSLNGAILYEITVDGDMYRVWFSPEETPTPIYLWRFYMIDDAKRYVHLREKKNRMNYTYTSATSDYDGEYSK